MVFTLKNKFSVTNGLLKCLLLFYDKQESYMNYHHNFESPERIRES